MAESNVPEAQLIDPAPHRLENELAQLKESNETMLPAGPPMLSPEAPASTHATIPLNPQLAASAKPYIPSYLAALKTHSATVMLEGVPVNVNVTPQQATTTEWCSSTNVSNSLLDNDADSFSWVDDDECFVQSISRAALSGVTLASAAAHGVDNSQVSANTASFGGGGGGSANGYRSRGKKGGGYDSRKGGWKHVDAGRGSGNATPGNERDSQGGKSVGNGKQRGRGGRHKNENRPRGGGTSVQRGQGGPAEISCGRFDVLSDAKIMRHL